MVASAGYDSYVATLKDADGSAVLAKANTKYIVRLAYVQKGAGTTRVNIDAGRKSAEASTTQKTASDGKLYDYSTATEVEGTAFGDFDDKNGVILGSVSETYPQGVQYATFNFTTGDMTDAIPEFNLVVTPQGVLGKYQGTGEGTWYGGVPQDENGGNKWGSSNWGRYTVVGLPEFEIQSIEIIEVKENETVVNFVKADEEILKKAASGTAFSAENTPANFEGKWYNTTDANFDSRVISAYPAAHANVYDFSALVPTVGSREYLSPRGIFVTKYEDKDVLKYMPYTYAEYAEKYNADIQSSGAVVADITPETALSKLNTVYNSAIYNAYRVSTAKLENGKTYKATITYKAPVAPNGINIKFIAAQDGSAVQTYNFLEGISIAQTDEWVTKTVYFNADLPTSGGAVAASTLYMNPYSKIDSYDYAEGRPELYISEIKVEAIEDAVFDEAAACLKDEVANAKNTQAIRMFFDYKTSADGSKIIIDGKEYEIAARGVIYHDGTKFVDTIYNNKTSTYFDLGNKKFAAEKTENFTNCWAYDEANSVVTFSNYIVGFNSPEKEALKLIARGYVKYIGEDGAIHTIYSAAINRSVDDIQELHDDSIENYETQVG